MSTHDTLIYKLIDHLGLQASALEEVRRAMADNRAMFVTMSARKLNEGLETLEPHWQVVEQLEEKLDDLLGEIRSTMQIEGKVRVSRLMEHLPRHLANRLRTAADAAERASRRVRTETTASARLLRISQRSHEETLRAFSGGDRNADHKSYDKHALAVGSTSRGGKLLLGTV